MEWKDIGNAIGKAAPILGTLVGGPVGGVVGGLISSALGVDNDPDSVSAALVSDPQAYAKLQELQLNAKVQLQQLQVTAANNEMQAQLAQFQAEVADRNSARDLAAKTPNDWVRPTITFMIIGIVATLIILVMTGVSNELLQNATASLTFGTIVGYLFSELKQCLAFYFGTTKTSSDQTKVMTDFAVSPGSVTLGNHNDKQN